MVSLISAGFADEVMLQAPLTTIVSGWAPSMDSDGVLRAVVVVPADAPADLGVGAWIGDRHGRWFQRALPGNLAPGRHVLAIAMDGQAPLRAEPLDVRARWNAAEAAAARCGGLFFWSQHASRAILQVTLLPSAPGTSASHPALRLLDLHLPPPPRTGERWEVRVTPSPYPENPCDPADFRLDLVVHDPSGQELRIPAFHDQPMRSHDRGDRELALPAGEPAFAARWRASRPGWHHLSLEARWRSGASLIMALPDQLASGEPGDDIVRVDRGDPRFLSANGHLVWPHGPNLRSVWDVRGQKLLGTRLTVDRGTLAYDAYLTRAAAGGADVCEIWMSSWNLALEWNANWDGFHGLGRWNLGNAWKLDRILDRAEALGMRINLVINNHGQASEKSDAEWGSSPWNRANGGPLSVAAELFTDRRAAAGQAALRRYLVGRYGDSPALLAWKLWSEINLTSGEREAVRRWHADASSHWHDLDPWRHPVTSHWSGDYRTVDAGIAALPGLDLLCIDAYHASPDENGLDLARLFANGLTANTSRSLARFGKPVLITEYGGDWKACPPAQLEAEFRSGAWLALVHGYCGGPLLWWFEWIDQGNRWHQYGALRRFLAGEDLRGSAARSLPLATGNPSLWAACWSRPGRRLGYLLDRNWGARGGPSPSWQGVIVDQGDQVPAGRVNVEWWDADLGRLVDQRTWTHPGGPLRIEAPPFTCHLAFKLWRQATASVPGSAQAP